MSTGYFLAFPWGRWILPKAKDGWGEFIIKSEKTGG